MTKINKFIQHVPAFVSGVDRSEFEFETTEDLLKDPWINNWTKAPFDYVEPNPDFHRFSLSENRLMAEMKGGTEWYVLGFIEFPDRVDLPVWVAKRDKNAE